MMVKEVTKLPLDAPAKHIVPQCIAVCCSVLQCVVERSCRLMLQANTLERSLTLYIYHTRENGLDVDAQHLQEYVTGFCRLRALRIANKVLVLFILWLSIFALFGILFSPSPFHPFFLAMPI